jgi:hypothetical protein
MKKENPVPDSPPIHKKPARFSPESQANMSVAAKALNEYTLASLTNKETLQARIDRTVAEIRTVKENLYT